MLRCHSSGVILRFFHHFDPTLSSGLYLIWGCPFQFIVVEGSACQMETVAKFSLMVKETQKPLSAQLSWSGTHNLRWVASSSCAVAFWTVAVDHIINRLAHGRCLLLPILAAILDGRRNKRENSNASVCNRCQVLLCSQQPRGNVNKA